MMKAHASRSPPRQKALDEAVAVIGDGTLAVPADVSSLADLDRLYALLGDEFGKLDVLFANAGVASFAPGADMTEQAFDLMVDLNIKGLYFTIPEGHTAAQQPSLYRARLICRHSMGNPGTTVYAATKAAIRSFARTFAAELVDRGVRVNAVSPGPILTPIMDKLGFSTSQRDDFLEEVKHHIPMKRLGTPDEVADAVLFLASNEASYVTGADLYVDGGQGQV
ncbi:MAG: SDR family oxidoreductase [Pararobbsia sp.]